MHTYYLVQNLIYNHKHIVKKNWLHKLFGCPNLTVDACEAESKDAATAKFIKDGHHIGITHDVTVDYLTDRGFMDDSTELKSCPFCGSDRVRRCGTNETNTEDNHECHHIVCDECGANMDLSGDSNSESIEDLFFECRMKWNSRV